MSSPLAEAFLLVTLNNCYETPSKRIVRSMLDPDERRLLDEAWVKNTCLVRAKHNLLLSGRWKVA